ncbi:MAG: head decoration protein [Roseburia sp.]|nr:head decoration protein [Roseburia sp.]
MKELSKHLGEMDYDGLFTDLTPKAQVRGGTIRKAATDTLDLKRGTVLAVSDKDNKLVILGTEAASGEKLTPDCILCDDIAVGATADEDVAVYTAGCFDPDKVAVASGYTMTASDLDNLRMRGIVFKAAAN